MKRLSTRNKIILCVIVMMLAAGCGLKANPVSPSSGSSQAQEQQKLFASVKDDTVVLTWTSPKGNYSHVNVEQSELGSTDNICKDCPRTYKRIADLTIKDESRFVDKLVEKGKSYSYRLGFCDEAGTCLPSQTVQLDMK